MSGPLKILTAIDIPWYSALTAYALEQARALRGRGHAVTLAAAPGSRAHAAAVEEGFPFFPITDRKRPLTPALVLRLRSFLASEGFDAFCAHTGRTQTLAALCALGRGGRPAIIRSKSDASPSSAGLSARPVAAFIAASGAIKKSYSGVPDERITVVPQGIEPPIFVPPPAEGPLRVGLLGRLDPVKGHAVLFKAAARLLEKYPGTRFVCAGGDANLTRGELFALAEDLGIAASVEFPGRIPDPFAFINSCHIGVVPSTGSEAVSRALLEWMACGRPAAASAVGGIPEMLDKEWLFPPENAVRLAELLDALLADPPLRESAGRANREAAAGKFSRGLFADLTERVFLSAVKA